MAPPVRDLMAVCDGQRLGCFRREGRDGNQPLMRSKMEIFDFEGARREREAD